VRTVVALDGVADRRWFLPAVSVFPLSDYVLPFLPNQMLLVALSVLHPRRWLAFAATFVIAAAAGALLAALLIQTAAGPWLLETVFGGGAKAGTAGNVLRAIESYGLFALAALAVLPWPPRTAVIVCAVAGLTPLGIGAAVAIGRIVPAIAYALIGAKSPNLLRRVPMIDRVLSQVGEARALRGAAIARGLSLPAYDR
jgi:hypothetical protein